MVKCMFTIHEDVGSILTLNAEIYEYPLFFLRSSYTVRSDRTGTFQKQEMEENTITIPSR